LAVLAQTTQLTPHPLPVLVLLVGLILASKAVPESAIPVELATATEILDLAV
jgi:hypothetical protein